MSAISALRPLPALVAGRCAVVPRWGAVAPASFRGAAVSGSHGAPRRLAVAVSGRRAGSRPGSFTTSCAISPPRDGNPVVASADGAPAGSQMPHRCDSLLRCASQCPLQQRHSRRHSLSEPPGAPLSQRCSAQQSPAAPAPPFDPLSREFILGQLKGQAGTLAVIFLALVACTACTTVTPLLSSAFFESLLGRLPANQFVKVRSVSRFSLCPSSNTSAQRLTTRLRAHRGSCPRPIARHAPRPGAD